jgi:hypothetical protein
MYNNQQNICTSEERVQKSDKFIHEPVAYVTGYYGGRCVIQSHNTALVFPTGTAFYTTPPKPWIGLTDEERNRFINYAEEDFAAGVLWAEAKLKDKNI